MTEQIQQRKGCNLKIPYVSTEQLIEDIQTLYPCTNHVFIYDINQRDSEGRPILTSRNLRSLKTTITRRVTRYPHVANYSDEIVGFDAKWHVVFVAVENGFAFIKVAGLNIGEAK